MNPSPFLFLCAAGLFAIFSSTLSKSPVLPLFAAHLGGDPAGVGMVASISAFAGVVFSIPAGILADRFGQKRMIAVSALVFATAPFGYLLVTDIWQLAAVRFYHGFATAIFLPVAMALVSSLSSKERGERLGWFSTATMTGRFMAPLVGGGIIGLFAATPASGFQVVYAVCGGAGLIALFLAIRLPAPETVAPARQSWPETWRVFKTVARDRRILMTCAAEASILFAYGTVETFLPLYAIENGLTAAQAGLFLSGQVVVLAFAKPIMGRFSDRHGRKPQIVAGGFAATACVGGFYFSSSFFPLFFLSVAFGLCLSVVTAATSAYIADLSSQRARGSAMGLLGSIMDIGHTTGPLVSGAVAASLGYAHSFLAAAFVLAAVATLFLLTLGPSDRLQT